MKKFKNPIIKGFHPDPSICRAGEDYYLVTSSFSYFPGLPVFHSRDLVNWRQIGHAIDRIDQIDYKNCDHSGGLWAPTIRYNNGVFYIINTFSLKDSEALPDSLCLNYVITTSDIKQGNWSDPIIIDGADGIDPSLFFDDDGSLWYTGNCCPHSMEWLGHRQIYLMELDPETFQPLGERKILWDGASTHDDYVEAPHIYKINGFYYLLIAAGGTQENHCVMIARSTSIDGVYEKCKRNPIATLRNQWRSPEFASAGHGDLIETQNGEWWMVLLAVRPYHGYQYNCGRETCLVPIAWDKQGWPYVDNESGTIEKVERVPYLAPGELCTVIGTDNFEQSELSMVWNTLRPWKLAKPDFASRPGYLRLTAQRDKISDYTNCAFVGRRQEELAFIALTRMESNLKNSEDFAGIALIQNHQNYILFGLEQSKMENNVRLKLIKCEQGKQDLCFEVEYNNSEAIYLGARLFNDQYYFFYGDKEDDYTTICDCIQAEVLSTTRTGGFTGVYMGMYITGKEEGQRSYADFDWFLKN